MIYEAQSRIDLKINRVINKFDQYLKPNLIMGFFSLEIKNTQ